MHYHCGNYPDDVVDIDTLRAAAPKTISKTLYAKHIMSLSDAKLRDWFTTQTKLIDDVRVKSQLLALVVDTSPKIAQLRLIGSEKSIAKAKMLLELHIKHQSEMHRISNERSMLSTKLEAEREKLSSGYRVEFPITRDVIGLVVGKARER